VQSAGDVSYVTLPKKGTMLEAGKEFGSIETGKWVGRLASPVTGEVIEVNEAAMRDPGLVNDTPYSDGWLMKIRGRVEPASKLMNATEYMEIVRAGRGF
jgi:glycine cleavage system H protein